MIESLRFAPQLAAWAAQKSLVGQLWVFGSRARGAHREDSDLDIAIKLDMQHSEVADDKDLCAWMFETESWASELQALVPFTIDLEQYSGPNDTPIIHAALARSSILIFSKTETPMGSRNE